MFNQQKHLCIIGLAVAAIATPRLRAQYTPPTSYSVTEINSMFGTPVTMQIYRDGSKAVIDNTNGTTHSRALYDLTAHTNQSWDASNPAGGCSSGKYSGDWGDPFTSDDVETLLKGSNKPPANETVGGFATQVFEATDPKSKIFIKVWRDKKSGLIVKADMSAPGATAATTIIEVKQFSAAKPDPALFALPESCKGSGAPVKYQTAMEKFAEAVGGAAADYVDASTGPGSKASCTMLLRMVDSKMQPLANFQVALDLEVDFDHPANYVMGGSPSGRTVFSGGHLKEYTDQVHGGVLKLDNVPDHFDVELTFAGGNKGAASALVYRKCATPQTVLLFVMKNPDNSSGGADWMWVKSGKFATVAGH